MDADNVVRYVSYFLNLTQTNYWCAFLGYLGYTIVFYIGMALICCIILDIFYVSYSLSKKKFRFLWPIKFLRNFVGLCVTVLFMPMMELFFLMFSCEFKEGRYQLVLFREVTCWDGAHTIHATLGIIFSFFFVCICLVFTSTVFEVKSKNDHPDSKITNRVEFFQVINKLILMIIFAFFLDQKFLILQVAWCIIGSAIYFFWLLMERPYYNMIKSALINMISGINAWSNFILLFNITLISANFTCGLEVFFF